MSTASNLYELLPAIYRVRDTAEGRPLQDLLRIIGEQVLVLEESLEQLYDDQFIETCADWVTPYLGDLIGYRSLHGAGGSANPRSEVANTIGYRRRKGTASMLEQLARDVTGWDARVVEFFERLACTQYMNHPRTTPPRGGTLRVRDQAACRRIQDASGAFDDAAHTVDVRRIGHGGRYGIRNIGIFLWRLHAYPLRRVDARKIAKGRFTFNPLGFDEPLFNTPQREGDISQLAEAINVPEPLGRRALHDELEARRVAPSNTDGARYFGSAPAFAIAVDGIQVPPDEITICRLEQWAPAPSKKTYARPDGAVVVRPISVAVDPVLGRLTLPAGHADAALTVDYAYGFSHDMGGGPYDRLASVASALLDVDFQIAVSRDVAPVAGEVCATLGEAVDAWNDRVAASDEPLSGIIAMLDSRTYDEDLSGAARVRIPAGARLLIAGADWPEEDVPGTPGATARVRGHLAPQNVRPHVRGNIGVIGTAADDDEAEPGTLLLNGLLIEGTVRIAAGSLGRIEVSHCTIVPRSAALTVKAGAARETQNARLTVVLEHTICGGVVCPASVPAAIIRDSIVTNGIEPDRDAPVLEAAGADVRVEASTIFGTASVRSISASNSIFVSRVETERRQVGCVRFSFAPLDSVLPRRYRCQPELEAATRVEAVERRRSTPITSAERQEIETATALELRPIFTATRYGAPAFGQLSRRCAEPIRRGADDESEMGAFHELFAPQREANLRIRLEEYLRVGLEAGLFYVS